MYKRLDIVGGIAGCVGGAGLACISYFTEQAGTLEIGAAVLVASAVYLIFRNRIASSSDPSLSANKSLTLIIHIIFLTTFAASIYLMHSSLFRPPLYFLLTSIGVAVVAMGLLSSSGKSQTWLLLLEILLISFSLRYGLLYELPGFYGVDPWWHSGFVEGWLDDSHISHLVAHRYTKYANFPVMHLNIMAMRLITFLGSKDAYFLSAGLFHVISTMFVFLLGQSLFNTKTGLLAALLISINIFHIAWGAWLIPTSLGVGIFIAIAWLIFKGTFNRSHALILIVMSVLLVFTHPMAALATAIALSLFLIVDAAYKRLYKTGVEKINIGLNLVILFWVLTLGSWIYASYSPSRSVFETVFTALFRTLRTDVEFVGGAFEASETPLGPLNRVGFLMFISLIVVGSLAWLWQKAISNRKLAIIIGAFGLAIVAFVLPLFNIENLIPGRWLPFVSVLGVVVAAEGIMALSRLFSGRITKSVAMVLILFISAMFLINSQAVNTCTPFYGRDYMQDPHRNAFFESELSAVETISEIYDGQITTDGLYSKLAFRTRVEPERLKNLDIEGGNEGLIAIRKYSHTHPVIDRYDKEKYDHLLAGFNGSEYNTIYDSGEVKAYLGR